MSATLTDLQRRVGEWGLDTFPDATHASICAHMAEEVGELAEAEYFEIPMELADVFLMLLHVAHREKIDLLAVAEQKFAICQQATWAFDAERGYVRRVKGGGR